MKHTEGDDKDNSTYLTASHCHSVDKGESLYIINSGLGTGATIYSLCPTLTGGKLDWGGKLYISTAVPCLMSGLIVIITPDTKYDLITLQFVLSSLSGSGNTGADRDCNRIIGSSSPLI